MNPDSGAALSWGGTHARPIEGQEEEEDLEAQLLRELEECEVCDKDYEEEEESWCRPSDGAAAVAQAGDSPGLAQPQQQPVDPAASLDAPSGEPAVSAAWAAFLQSSEEVEERFSAMQQSVQDCRQLMLPTPSAQQQPEPTAVPRKLGDDPPEAPGLVLPGEGEATAHQEAGGARGEGEEASPAAALPIGEDRAEESGQQRLQLLQALEALGPSLEGVISRARALVEEEQEEAGLSAPPVPDSRPPVGSHALEVEACAREEGGSEASSLHEEQLDGSGGASRHQEGGEGEGPEPSRAGSIQADEEPPLPPAASQLQQEAAAAAEDQAATVVVVEVQEEVVVLVEEPSSGVLLLELQAKRHEQDRADEERRLQEAQHKLRQEEERAAAAAAEERRVAAELRRRRRQEAVERLRKDEAAATLARGWRGVQWRRRVLSAMAGLRRARQAARRREAEAMAMEERRMRELLQTEARQAAGERRRMAEEERWMRVWCGFMALERERAEYEARGMAAEEQLARTLQRAERARLEAAREEAEREAMAAQDRDARMLQGAWQAEREVRRAVVAQKRLAMQLLARPTSTQKQEEGGDRWRGPGVEEAGGLLAGPAHVEDQLLRWAREAAGGGEEAAANRSAASYMCQRYGEWRAAMGPHLRLLLLQGKPPQQPPLLPRPAAASRAQASASSGGPGHRLSLETLQGVSSEPLSALTRLELCVEGLSDVAALAHCPRLQRLELNVNRLRDLCSLSGVSASLVDVSVKDNGLTSLQGIEALTRLTDLVVDINQLRSLDGVEALPGLRSLSANTNAIADFPPFHRSSSPSSPLQRLLLYHNQIEWLPAERLRPLTSLTTLDLGRNRLSSVSGEALSACVSLTKLVLSQNKLGSAPCPLHLPLLRELWLSGNRITSLAPWREQQQQASSTPTPPKEAAGGAALRHMWLPSLRVLFLQDNRLDSHGFPPGCLLGCPLLEQLDLSFNRLADLPAAAMGLGLACPALTSLQLHDNELCQRPEYATVLLQRLPRLHDYDGKEVDESKRWHARSQLVRGAHQVVPFMAELRRRGRDALSVPAKLLSDWRRAPRTLACPSCHHHFLLHPQQSRQEGSAAALGQQEPPSVACPQCGSAVRHVDFAGSGWQPFGLDWDQVQCWQAYDASRRSMRRTRLSPEQTALARLLSRCSRDTADEGPALAARHRRLLMTAVEGEGGGKGADDALVQRKAVVAAEVEGWARARLQAVMQAAQGGAQHQWFCWEEQQQLRSRPVQQAAQGSTSQDGRSGPDPAARRIQAMWRRFQARSRDGRQRPAPAAAAGGGSGVSVRAWGGQEEEAAAMAREAVTKLQSAFRGFHVRRALQAALESAKYVDRELDDILLMGRRASRSRGQEGEEEDEEDEILIAPPPDGILDEWEYRGPHRTPTTTRPPGGAAAIRPPPALGPVAAAGGGGLLLPPSSSASTPSCLMPTPPRSARRRSSTGAAASSPSLRRGGLMLAPLTTDSAGSTQHDGRHGDDEPGSMDHSPRALSEPSGRGHDQHVKEQAFIDEWGITDDKLAHTLLQRRSKIKKLQGQQARRENMKKSAYRYRRFVEQSSRPPSLAKQQEQAPPPDSQPKTMVIGAGSRRSSARAGDKRGPADRGRPAWASPGGDG